MNEELSKIESFLKGDSAVNRQLSSRAWLNMYGLKNNKIDRSSVLQNIGFPVRGEYHHCLGKYIKSCYGDNLFVRITNDRTGDVYNVIAKKGYIKQLKMKITQAVDLYRDRLTWLTSGSRSIFGVIQEHSAVFLLDIKTQSPEIFSDFVNSLKCLISEQIANMKMINMIRCQDEPYFFSDELVSVDTSTLKNMLEWINTLERLSFSSSSCTTDCILRMGQFKKSFESVYLITEGESTMTSPELLENIVKTLKHPLHIVSYCCEDMKTIDYLHNLCTYTGGRFHAYCINTHIPSYSPSCWDVEQFQQKIHVNKVEYGGPPKGWGQHEDCVLIFEELEEARSLLQRIEEVLHDIDRIPDEVLKDSNYECSQPAPITNSCEFGWKREEYMSSKEWLSIHGLKAQHLDFYDLLVSVSFKHCDGVVNVLKPPLNVNNNDAMDRECNKIYDDFGKSNHSEADSKDSSQIWSSNAIIQPKLINAQYCSNFVHIRWKNGNIVHVQITPEMYRSYSRRMHSRLNAIKHRLDLLRQGSRELFGTITEDNVYILIDTSTSMLSSIKFVKEKLLQLIYEQLKYKNRLNFIAFNSNVNAWHDHLQSTTECNLNSAIKWIEKLTCGGTTNTLKALQFALEDNLTEGIYLLTDGRPDQQTHTLLLSMQLNNRVPIHTISFNCNDPEANEFLIRLAQESGGRFHYYNEFPNNVDKPKQWESEDVRLLENEYQIGLDNLEKLAQLKDECYLLRMKANKETATTTTATVKHSQKENKQLELTEKNQSILPKKSHSIVKSTDTINSETNSTCSQKQRQSKWNTTTNSIVSTVTNNPAEFIRYPTVLNNHSNIIKHPQSTVKKKFVEKMFNDTYYPNLQNLYKTSLDEKDFLLYETKQLLERQSQRFNKAITDEILLNKTKQKVSSSQGSDVICTIPNWLSHNGLAAKKLRLTDLLKSFTVRLRPTYIPALRHHVVSEVLKQTLPIAYVNKKKFTRSPEIRLFNPLAINFEQYEKSLRNALFIIEKKLIEIIFEYIDNDSLNNLRKDVNLDKYKKWRSKLCWYQDYATILKTFKENNWPFPQNEFNLLTNELDMGQKYLNEAKHLKSTGNPHRSYRSLKQMNSTFDDRAPCGHPYRIHH
uniref:VWFA domain-containing protein n=1 Tax=Schistosoma mansoni TaxID=6183 RepID=A0A3Q0KL76_SCHMA